MLEIARPQTRARTAQPQHDGWGPVDVILAVPMLPFGLAALLIERFVWAVTSVFSE